MNIDVLKVSVCVCLLAAIFEETSEVKTIKLDTVTASVIKMHHVLVLTLTFIQGHTDLNHISLNNI